MSERSLIAYEGFREGTMKFDYFMCGLIGAVFAYIAQGYQPTFVCFGPRSLEPVSVVLLGVSLFCGIKRLERANQVMLINHKLFEVATAAEKYAAVLDQGKFPIRRSDTDEMLDERACRERLKALRDDEASGKANAVSYKRSAGRYYRYRQHLFFLGVVALIEHRLLLPYA